MSEYLPELSHSMPSESLPVPSGSASRSGRVPPQAVNVEKTVLGAMLIEREAIPKAVEILQPGSFYSQQHNAIYEAILSLFERSNPVDLITVGDELKRRDKLESVGGSYYLSELTAAVDTAANVEYHARIVAEKALLRGLIETMTTVVGQAYDASADAFELLDHAESEIFRISDSQLRRAATSMHDVLKETLSRLEAIHGQVGGVTGVPSGFTRLDQLTGGWQPSDLIIIAARPSMGKTAFSLAMARNAALHPEHPAGVAIFSLEMSAGQLAQRLLTSEARVDAQAARTGRLSDDDWPRLARAAGRLSEAPIFIDDTPGLTVLELRAKCRRLKAEHDIGLVIVDYLQLMHGTGMGKNANREQEIAHISRSLKGLAKELNVPVIALSQLSRAVETRGGDKRPQLSDLRESGSIEQDADVVGFIYRAERYGITVDENGNSTEGLAEIIIGKQRNGPIDDVKLAWVNQYARFENLTTYYAPTDYLSEGPNSAALPEADETAPF
ncbi:MAG: replicative DNA helicase [Bacteroidetes bacterium]|nr:replicative DNA helicase [Bacteroidota bacterium]